MYPFERFTERAKKVLTLAQEEAESAGHSYIGPEHLLLGLLIEGEGLAAQALAALGVELDGTRAAIQALLGAAPRTAIFQIVPTARVKKVIETAFEESQRMGHAFVGTEHLLLGLLVEGESVAARVLADTGVTLEKARAEVDRLLKAGEQEATVAPPPGRPRPGPMRPELRLLLLRAQAQAAGRGSSELRLEHLLETMVSTSAGLEALARLLDWRRLAALKEQAIAGQDYETAAGHRADERRARQALEEAVTAWRQELEPPQEAPATSS
jgi:ATP-dependent Clp protease ATP-binding subunit ClpA